MDYSKQPTATTPHAKSQGRQERKAQRANELRQTANGNGGGAPGRGEYRHLVRPKRRHRIDGWKKSALEPLPT